MANTRKRVNKDGSVVYEIRVSRGYDENGKQRKPYQMTWKAPSGWSQRSIDKALETVKNDFERDCREGKILTREERIEKEKREKEAERQRREEEERQLTFEKYVEVFIKHRESVFADNTIVGYRQTLGEACAVFGKKKMIDIRPVDIKNYITDLQTKRRSQYSDKPLAHKTVLKRYINLHALFESAVEDEVIPYSPMQRMKRPKPRKDEAKNTKPKSYTAEEIQRIIASLDSEPTKWQALMLFMIDSGCRRGEAIGLKWENIDFESGKVEIINNAQYTEGKGTYITTPKSGKGRTITINPPVLKVLLKWRREQSLLFFQQRIPRSEFVFTHEDGTSMNPQAPTAYMKRLGKKCGIESLHPHALRHTMASLSIANGADIVSVSQKLGHSEVATTLNIYAHENEEAKEKASQVLADTIYMKRA